jgi:hypothetical protein
MGNILEHFVQVIALFHRVIGVHVRANRQDDSVLGLAYWHADRIRRRFISLYTKWTNGTLKPTRQRARRTTTTPESSLPSRACAGGAGGGPTTPETQPKPENPPKPEIPKAPRKRGWVTHMAPPCAEAGGWLHYFLQRDDMPAFLAAVPRAGRLLRPLCHMLGVTPPEYLKLPPRPRKPRKRKSRPQYGPGGKYPSFNARRYSPGRIPDFKIGKS